MSADVFSRRVRLDVPVQDAFDWHACPGAFERLTPPWQPVRLVESTGGIEDGGRVEIRVRMAPGIWARWVAEHRDFEDGRRFRDVQVVGPFSSWDHRHLFEEDGPDACRLEDRIEYSLPLGAVGRLIGGRFVRKKLERVFRYRHRTTLQDISSHRQSRTRGMQPMKILVSGASGFVGSTLVPFLTTGGHEVVRLGRSSPTGVIHPTLSGG